MLLEAPRPMFPEVTPCCITALCLSRAQTGEISCTSALASLVFSHFFQALRKVEWLHVVTNSFQNE